MVQLPGCCSCSHSCTMESKMPHIVRISVLQLNWKVSPSECTVLPNTALTQLRKCYLLNHQHYFLQDQGLSRDMSHPSNDSYLICVVWCGSLASQKKLEWSPLPPIVPCSFSLNPNRHQSQNETCAKLFAYKCSIGAAFDPQILQAWHHLTGYKNMYFSVSKTAAGLLDDSPFLPVCSLHGSACSKCQAHP